MKVVILAIVFFSISVLSAEAAVKKDTVTTKDGLKYIVLHKGHGKKAKNGMKVSVNYSGYLTNGKEFDSSYKRGRPIKFVLGKGQVIKGWDEGIALMRVGDKFRLIIPPDLAYGSRKAGMIPPNSTLIFDTQLMKVQVAKLSLADTLLMAIFNKGIDSAVKKFHRIMKTDKNKYDLDEDQLNALGIKLLKGRYTKQAIGILKLNAELHPKSSNVYDLLGESYYLGNNKHLAKKSFEKSLKLNPNNKRVEEMLKRLKDIK